jgi:hypothetical protein
MRTLIALALSTTLIASTAFAADVGPLAPGKPASVKQAQDFNIGAPWALLGIAVVVGVVAVVASSSRGNGGVVQPTTQLAVTTTTG